MDSELRARERRRRVSPDDEIAETRAILAAARGDPKFIPSLYQRLVHALDHEYRRRPLDVVVPVDPDSPLASMYVYVNRLEHILGTSVTFELTADGKRARIRGSGFDLVHGDIVQVVSNGPLGGRVEQVSVVDPRRASTRASEVRHVCNDCDEEIDQHGDCLCTVGLYDASCPYCGGSGFDPSSVSSPEPCRACNGEGTRAEYEKWEASELRD